MRSALRLIVTGGGVSSPLRLLAPPVPVDAVARMVAEWAIGDNEDGGPAVVVADPWEIERRAREWGM